MCVPRTATVLLTRNLLYTGITRAKDLLIIVGDKNVTEFMINNVDSKKRNTGLEYKLKLKKDNYWLIYKFWNLCAGAKRLKT